MCKRLLKHLWLWGRVGGFGTGKRVRSFNLGVHRTGKGEGDVQETGEHQPQGEDQHLGRGLEIAESQDRRGIDNGMISTPCQFSPCIHGNPNMVVNPLHSEENEDGATYNTNAGLKSS